MIFAPTCTRRHSLPIAATALALPLLAVTSDPPPAAAGPLAAREFRVSTTTDGDQASPAVAMDADGDFAVAWTGLDQDGYGVYVQRYDAAGIPQGTETRVNTSTNYNQYEPSIAMDADGDFVIVWTGVNQATVTREVHSQRYDAAGTPQGTETQVNSTTIAGTQIQPAVAMDADGDHVITWTSQGQDGSDGGVYAQRYDAAGTPQGTETQVNSTTTDGQIQPAVAMDADGDYVIAWTSENQDGSDTGIFAQRYDATGTPRGTETQANTTASNFQSLPDVAMDANGDYVITWTSEAQDGSAGGVYAQRFDAGGAARGTETRVNTTTADHQLDPTLAIDADGDYAITWVSSNQDGSSWGVYVQRFDAMGVPQGPETQVAATTRGSQEQQAVAMDADGGYLVAWASHGQDGSGYGVFGRRFRGFEAVDLRLTQADSADPVAVGRRVAYRIRVSNLNEPADDTGIEAVDTAIGAASGILVVSTIPDGATFVSSGGADWTCNASADKVRCRLPSPLAAGDDSPALVLRYTAPTSAEPMLHTARVDQSPLDPVSANNLETERTEVRCTLELSAATYSGSEGATVVGTVTRNGTDCDTSGVSYATTAGSATPGLDYTSSAGTLTWADGQTTKSVTIPLVDDGLDEKVEQFNLVLTNPTGALLGIRSQATGGIVDNDDPPRVNFTATAATLGEPGGLLDVTVRLSEVSGQDVPLVLAKAGTATYLSDYFAPKRVTIPAGLRSVSFDIEVADDKVHEGTEQAIIVLANPAGSTAATIGSQKTFKLTITSNE